MTPTVVGVRRVVVAAGAAALLAVAAVACSSDGDGGGSSDDGATTSTAAPTQSTEAGVGDGEGELEMDGRTFTSTSVTGETLVEGTVVRITFAADSVAVDAGCNSMNGPYEVAEDGTIAMPTELASTMIGCEEALAAQDAWIDAWLRGGVTGTVDGDVLTLVGGDITIEATAAQGGPDSGVGSTPVGSWTLDTIVEGEVASSVPADVETPTLEIADGTATLFTGCNNGTGGVEVSDDALSFQPMAITFRACDGAAGDLEATVLAVLSDEVPYVTDGETMTTGTDERSLVWRRS